MEEGRNWEDSLEEVAAANSEMRYLCLELMKLAEKRGVSFEAVVKEFIVNTNVLKHSLARYEERKRR